MKNFLIKKSCLSNLMNNIFDFKIAEFTKKKLRKIKFLPSINVFS